jgi:hypothetical protein
MPTAASSTKSSSRWRATSQAQIAGGSKSVFGVMVESHLNAGAQKFTPGKDDATQLEYGKSITDACLGWGDSLQALDVLSQAVTTRRRVESLAEAHQGHFFDVFLVAKAPPLLRDQLLIL